MRTGPWWRWVWAAALVAVVGSPSGVGAQEGSEREETLARAYFEAGAADFETGNYESALVAFRRAYELSGRPALLYNLYMAHERLGRYEEAAEALEGYVASLEESERRDVLQARAARLRERAEAEAAREADAGEDAPPVETRDPAAPVEPESTSPATAPVEEAPGRVSAPPDRPLSSAVWILGAVTAVATVSFATFAILSELEDGDLASTCGRDAGRTCSEDDVGTLETYNLVADLSLGLALVGAAATATVWLLLAGDGGEAEVGVAGLPGGAALSVRGAF